MRKTRKEKKKETKKRNGSLSLRFIQEEDDEIEVGTLFRTDLNCFECFRNERTMHMIFKDME